MGTQNLTSSQDIRKASADLDGVLRDAVTSAIARVDEILAPLGEVGQRIRPVLLSYTIAELLEPPTPIHTEFVDISKLGA
jgi:hypothetical protein